MRKYGIAWLGTVLIIGGLIAFAATQERWILALLLLHVALAASVVVILIAIRQLSHVLHTQSRNNKMALAGFGENLADSLDAIREPQGVLVSSLSDALRKMEIHRDDIVSLDTYARAAATSISEYIEGVGFQMQKEFHSSVDRITKTIRHGSNEIESFIDLFSRFPGTSWPMPSTGGWAIDAQGLNVLLALVEDRRPARILELGSGTSTIWLGYLCRVYGGELITLDHLEAYLHKTQTAVDLHGLSDYVDCRLAPLQQLQIGDAQYPWYAVESFGDLSDIDMVVVDGPPAATGPKARYPALPATLSRLSSKVTIVLDDAHRSDESEIMEAWQSFYPAFTRLEVGFPSLAVLQRGY